MPGLTMFKNSHFLWHCYDCYFVVAWLVRQLHVINAWIFLCYLLLTQGMMGNYGPPYMPMQGPSEGMMGMGGTPPHPMGVPQLPSQHYLLPGMAGYPGMPHPGKKHPDQTETTPEDLLTSFNPIFFLVWNHGFVPKSSVLPGQQGSLFDFETQSIVCTLF